MRKEPEREALEWNRAVKIGDRVEYRSFPGANPKEYETESAAEVLGGHTAVVWLTGKSGCVAVSACRTIADLRLER